jgi:hypothetical protein
MVTIFPEGTPSVFPSIIFLGCPAGNQLQRPGYNILVFMTVYQQVNMIRGVRIVQYLQPVPLFRFKQPFSPCAAVFGELQQKFLFVASMGNMPHMISQKISVGSGHGCLHTYFEP